MTVLTNDGALPLARGARGRADRPARGRDDRHGRRLGPGQPAVPGQRRRRPDARCSATRSPSPTASRSAPGRSRPRRGFVTDPEPAQPGVRLTLLDARRRGPRGAAQRPALDAGRLRRRLPGDRRRASGSGPACDVPARSRSACSASASWQLTVDAAVSSLRADRLGRRHRRGDPGPAGRPRSSRYEADAASSRRPSTAAGRPPGRRWPAPALFGLVARAAPGASRTTVIAEAVAAAAAGRRRRGRGRADRGAGDRGGRQDHPAPARRAGRAGLRRRRGRPPDRRRGERGHPGADAVAATRSTPCSGPGCPGRRAATRSPPRCSATSSRPAGWSRTFPVADGAAPAWSVTPVDGDARLRRGHVHRLPRALRRARTGAGVLVRARARLLDLGVRRRRPVDGPAVTVDGDQHRQPDQPGGRAGLPRAGRRRPAGAAGRLDRGHRRAGPDRPRSGWHTDARLWRRWTDAGWDQLPPGGRLLVARGLGDIRDNPQPLAEA